MRLSAVIEYDGTAYQGWQSQSGHGATVQEAVERALSIVLRAPVRVAAAGRTDAGVHARGQVIAFDAPGLELPLGAQAAGRGRGPLETLLRSLNAVLPDDISARSLRVVRDDFDPRRDAVRRAYRYRIWNAAVRSPFEARTAWHVRDRLDERAMHEAAQSLLGERDFASFQGADHVPRASVRVVHRVAVERCGDLVAFAIEANAFARHMVRNIVGELVEIGRGKQPPGRIADLLVARDRRLAAPPAPPQGLILEWVRYPEDA